MNREQGSTEYQQSRMEYKHSATSSTKNLNRVQAENHKQSTTSIPQSIE